MGCSTLHIKTELDCRVFLFDEEKGIAKTGIYFNLDVRKGEQDLLFISTNDETLRCKMLYNVEENDCDYRIILEKSEFQKLTLDEMKHLAEQGDLNAKYAVEGQNRKKIGASILMKKLIDLQKEGKHLQTGIANSKNGDKIFLYVDPDWTGLNVGLCAFAKGGRPFRKDDYVRIWRKNKKLYSAVFNDRERTEYENSINIKPPYYLFFDTETTGVPNDYNAPASNTRNWPRLVQLGWILTDENDNILHQGNEIIRPEGFDIPTSAVMVHGITTEKAMRVGKPLRDVILKFLNDVKQAECLVGHNISFDQHVVGAELYRLNLQDIVSNKRSICTMQSTIDFCQIPGYVGYKYPKLQELYNKLFCQNFEDAHDAMADITATKECFFELLRIGVINDEINDLPF